MGIFGLPPQFVAAVMLLVSAPREGATLESEPVAVSPVVDDLDVSEPKRTFEVVAASPLPAGFHPGSGFGYRASPRTGERTFHAGADFLAPVGTPVYAVHSGIVEAVAQNHTGARVQFAGYGNAVVVYHPDLERWSFYAHLSRTDVVVGQKVGPGELLGAVGNTTNGRFRGMAVHLHFEVRHATFAGGSPFPGPYRTFNENPERFLTSLGVEYPEVEVEAAEVPAPLLVVREVPTEAPSL